MQTGRDSLQLEEGLGTGVQTGRDSVQLEEGLRTGVQAGRPRDWSAGRRAWGLECRQEGISVQLEEGLGTGVRQEEIQCSWRRA